MGDVLGGARTNAHQMDQQINILIGVNTAIFLYAAGQLLVRQSLAFLILALSSAISILIGLLGVHPPRRWRKQGQQESLLYASRIFNAKNSLQYAKELTAVTKRLDSIEQQYAIETYNINRFYYRPKKELFHLARQILIIGVVASTLVVIAETFIHLV